MRYFMDCEFIDDGKTIDLISIGIVCEDGRELYAQSIDFSPKKASTWVWENVLPHLKICPNVPAYGPIEAHLPKEVRLHLKGQCVDQQRGWLHDCPWRTREQLVHEIKIFFNPSDGIELWGYYSAYDHVAFCQLFGTMMDLPKGYPMYTRDLKQWCDALGNPELPQQEVSQHHALADARHHRLVWQILKEKETNDG
jgi:hypothetical protein